VAVIFAPNRETLGVRALADSRAKGNLCPARGRCSFSDPWGRQPLDFEAVANGARICQKMNELAVAAAIPG